MRIVQTFWTAGQDPLRYSFGWLHPEYNLMSWALSCLSLREHYDEVVLYTDSIGKRILIDTLHLPYTDVQVTLDDFQCLPLHWALAKVKTYSLQTKPFLHVDGDVYIPKALDACIEQAPLIAQNKEIGTNYYKDMMQRVCQNPNITLPSYIRKALNEDSISSYNMGVFGGNDISFIKEYCDVVFQFIESNGLNDISNPNSRIECNVFFEQIILAAIADQRKYEVGNILGHDMFDQGYTVNEFCNLYEFHNRPIHHLLGGHKRNPRVLKMLRHFVANKHPTIYNQLVEIFFKAKTFTVKSLNFEGNWLINDLSTYTQQCMYNWQTLPIEECMSYERRCMENATTYENVEKNHLKLSVGWHLKFYEIPIQAEAQDIQELREYLSCEKHIPLKHLAIIPSFIGKGAEIIPLLDIDMEILKTLETSTHTITTLINQISNDNDREKTKNKSLEDYLLQETQFLIKKDIIFTNI